MASLALEFGVSKDEGIAALLHDVLEDGPDHARPVRTPDDLRREIVDLFGEPVALLVDAATDDTPLSGQAKKDWAIWKLRRPLIRIPYDQLYIVTPLTP